MANINNNAWKRVVECALTASIDYKSNSPRLANNCTVNLEECLTRYIVHKAGYTTEEARATYSSCLANALKQEQPGNKYSNLAHIGSCVGTISLVILLFTAVATHLNLFFVIMALVAASFVKTCSDYLKKTKLRNQAVQIWKDAIKSGSMDDLEQALIRMEKLFISN